MTTDHILNYKYSGFHGVRSSCEVKVFRKSNLIVASHNGFHGTSPTNMAESLAQRIAKEFRLNIKRINMVIHVPSDYSFNNTEDFSILRFNMSWKRGRISVYDADFFPLELDQLLKIISGREKISLGHKIRYSII